MKILLINTFDTKGGAAKFCYRLKKNLDKNNIVNWLIVKSKEKESSLQFKISFLQKILNKILKTEGLGKSTLKELKGLPFWDQLDLIHFHNLHGGYFNIFNLPKLSKEKRCVWTLHDPWILDKKNVLVPEYKNIFKGENKIFNKIKKELIDVSNITLVTPSVWLKNKVEKEYPNKKIELIPNGIDTSLFKPINKKEVREKLGIPINKTVVLFVANGGKDNIEKGSEYINLVRKHFENFLIIELGGNNQYVESEKDMAEYYSAAELLLFPSLAENFPLSILESMSCGTPVLAFDTGGIKEIIDHEINGYVAKYKDENDLINGIKFITTEKTLSQKAREKIVNNFDEQIIFKKYQDLYKKIIN